MTPLTGDAKLERSRRVGLSAQNRGADLHNDWPASNAAALLYPVRDFFIWKAEPDMSVGFTIAAISGVKRLDEMQLREKILDVVCENGAERESVLATQQLAGKIDSLKLLEIIEVLEDTLHRPIPEEELTEKNFSSVPVLLQMANRLAQAAR